LAFIGGPGEVGYWAVLKPAFKAMQMKMPPVLPRLSFTFIDRNVEKFLSKYSIHVEHAVNYGVEDIKQDWLNKKQDPPIHELSVDIKQKIKDIHKPLRDAAKGVRADLGDLADKNLLYLQDTIDFLEGRINKTIEEKYAREIEEFDLISLSLRPEGGLQERIWNPIFWLNHHGTQFLQSIIHQDLSMKESHFVVWL
ncbi:bacillithiol biosynthesis BshC, partial [Halomonas sp. MG34]|nr:bacillithiol biosynthesis BshC [Halomonas sp. MG34]